MKIAFHLGSTAIQPFILNQILSITDKNIEILIFGSSIHHNAFKNFKEIKLYLTPRNKIGLILHLTYNISRLIFFYPTRIIGIVHYLKNLSNFGLKKKIIWLIRILPLVVNLPDILHIQWAKSIKSWIFIKKEFGVKLVLSLRGTHINISPINDKGLAKLYQKTFPYVSRFHAVSKSLAEDVLKYGVKKNKIDIIHTPINFKNIKIQKKSWELKTTIQVISVGRIKWVKGYQIALSAIKKLNESGFNIRYTIIAPEKPGEEILYQIEDLDLQNRVFFKSYNEQGKIYQMMSQSDCLILPSVSEGIANVVYEAISIKLPVISSDCGGMKEIIKNGYNGYLFKNRNVLDLVDTIKSFLETSLEDRELLVKNAKDLIFKKNDINYIGEKMKSFYIKSLI